MTVVLRARDGSTSQLAVDDWCAPATPGEVALLESLSGPVVDLGCGPGRLVVALQSMGTPALGVDASTNAVAHARAAGAAVLRRSVFDRLPGEGRWQTALLVDGNVGIGGDPIGLFQRVASLLSPGGRALIEVRPPGATTRIGSARLERDDEVTSWFPWAWVGLDALRWLSAPAGLVVVADYETDGRWFGVLERA